MSDFTCTICDSERRSLKALALHESRAHGIKGIRMVEATCEACGLQFLARRSAREKGQARFCSSRCWGRYLSIHQRGERGTNWKGGPKRLRCRACNASFEVARSRRGADRAAYCSAECYHNARRVGGWRMCASCGKPFLVRGGRRRVCCSKVCQTAWLRGERHYAWTGGSGDRRAWEHGGGTEWRRAVRATQQYRCLLCGVQHHERSALLHVHHTAAFADYPELRSAVENGKCVCKRCGDGRGHDWLHSSSGLALRLRWQQEAIMTLAYLLQPERCEAVA